MKPPYARQAAMQRQNDSAARDEAYKRVTAACNAVEAHIATHGRDGLVAFCAAYAGQGATMCTAIMSVVWLRLGKEARDDVREVLP